jgi:hypothetical protein
MSSTHDTIPLRFAERRIATLNKCYCVAPYVSADEPQRAMFLVASEQDDPCFLFDAATGAPTEKLWDAPGGVMSMVQLRENNGRMVLATQQFYGPDNSGAAKLVIAVARTPAPSADAVETCAWRCFVLAEMPFVHRFDVVPGRGAERDARYIIACTLKSSQSGPGDWSQPGQVWAARLPDDMGSLLPPGWHDAADGTPVMSPLTWQVLQRGCLKNHGYYRHTDLRTGEVNCVVGCDAGVFLFRPPLSEGAEWGVTQLTAVPASDAALVDLDRDGLEELLVISPFHGDTVMVYHQDVHAGKGVFVRVYIHPTPLPFLHAIWGGTLGGCPCVVLGHRAGNRDLLLFSHSATQGYHVDCIARDCGPANVMKLTYTAQSGNSNDNGDVRECIVSCNRETDTVVLYDVTPSAAA